MKHYNEAMEKHDTVPAAAGSRQCEGLHSSKAMLRAMVDGTQALVILLDTRGVVVDANSIALAFIGASIEQVVDVPFENTEWCNHDANQVELLRDAISRAAAGEHVCLELTRWTGVGDLRTLDLTITPCRDKFGVIVWLVSDGREVTELRRLEVERNDLEQRLNHLERVESSLWVVWQWVSPMTSITS